MSAFTRDHAPHCRWCGRFCIPASGLFVPDSYFGPEEQAVACGPCTVEHGPPLPHQSGVDWSKVQWRLPT